MSHGVTSATKFFHNLFRCIHLSPLYLRPCLRDIRFQLFQFQLFARHGGDPKHRHGVAHNDKMHIFRSRLFRKLRKVTPELFDANESGSHGRKEKGITIVYTIYDPEGKLFSIKKKRSKPHTYWCAALDLSGFYCFETTTQKLIATTMRHAHATITLQK
jgi:hypothetical protein